jgi:hypothetical protein
MPAWNEIRQRAIGFSRENRDKTSEEADKQSYWNDFFHIFGIKRRTVASFEEPVKKLSGNIKTAELMTKPHDALLAIENRTAAFLDNGGNHTQGRAA